MTQYDPQILASRLEALTKRIQEAQSRSPHDQDVTLVAVSKTHPPEAIKTFYDLGVRHFGENYVQEWRDKAAELPDDIHWHFVGRLQSNKAKYLADRVHRVHSIDRKSVIKKLSRRSSTVQSVFLQVNLDDQETKGGVAVEDVCELFDRVAQRDNLKVVGLMGMPPYVVDPEESRPHFQTLREALETLKSYVAEAYPDRLAALTELSMGMTNDFEVAIEEGATLIRVGTALFGQRSYDD